MLFSIYIVQIVYLSFELECEKNENKQKEAGIGPFLKKKDTCSSKIILDPIYIGEILQYFQFIW